MIPTLSLSKFKTDSRGQLILLGALVIVISLVVIVTALNTVLYAQNIESHETAPEGKEAAEYIDTAQQAYGDVLTKENTQNHTSAAIAHSETKDSLYAINTGLGEQYAHKHGMYATINPLRVTNGTVIRHTNANCTFESAKADCNGGENDDPIASFSFSPSEPEAGTDIIFDGGHSTDPDGSIESYEWDFTGNGFIDASGESTTHAYASPGVYEVTLRVTDNDGATDTRTKTVAVSDSTGAVPPVPAFSFSPDNPEPDENITFSATASTDANGDISSYEWDFTGDGTVDATGEEVTTSYDSTGARDVSVTVTDSAGYSRTKTKRVTVASEGSDGRAYSFGASDGTQIPSGQNADVSTTDWELGTTTDVRQFRFTVEAQDLDTAIDSSELTNLFEVEDNAFHVVFTDRDGNSWRVYIYRSSTGDIVVSTQENGGDITIQYQESVDEATIDLTTGNINDEKNMFEFAPGVSQAYTIEYRNGDAASGEYMLVVPNDDFGESTLRSGNFNTASSTQSPYTAAGIYSTRFRLTFNSPAVEYETTIRVAPNEPGGGN